MATKGKTKKFGRKKENREGDESKKSEDHKSTPNRADEKSNMGKVQRKLVFKFVKHSFEKGIKGLIEEFTAMKRINDFEKMKVYLENKDKNRYKDVGCLDNARVKLRDFGDNDYIHANFVKTPHNDKRFICAQAPLEKTCPDFWCMVLQEEVENIVMLCNFTEKGLKKSHEYFPTEADETLTFGDFAVKCIERKDFKFRCDTKTELKVTSLVVEAGGKSQKLTHYHWIDWPDRTVPPADLAIIELLQTLGVTKTPIVIHCSAGIGRTGSVVLIQYILEMVETGQTVEDCAGLLKELRQQRSNSVQTYDQYLFVHMVLMNYWAKNKVLDESVEKPLKRFAEAYTKLFESKEK